jgi:hypothetical protein
MSETLSVVLTWVGPPSKSKRFELYDVQNKYGRLNLKNVRDVFDLEKVQIDDVVLAEHELLSCSQYEVETEHQVSGKLKGEQLQIQYLTQTLH